MEASGLNKEQEVARWVNEYSEALLAYAIKRLNNETVAQDLVQVTFMSAFQSFDKFKAESSPKTWLTSILKNKIMDHYRQVYRKKETSLSEGVQHFDENGMWLPEQRPTSWGPDHLLDDEAFNVVFAECMKALPERWNLAVRLKYLDKDIDFDDLGITKANYWKILERARTQLRGCIQSNWFDKDN